MFSFMVHIKYIMNYSLTLLQMLCADCFYFIDTATFTSPPNVKTRLKMSSILNNELHLQGKLKVTGWTLRLFHALRISLCPRRNSTWRFHSWFEWCSDQQRQDSVCAFAERRAAPLALRSHCGTGLLTLTSPTVWGISIRLCPGGYALMLHLISSARQQGPFTV